MNLSDLVAGKKANDAPYAQSLEQRESSIIKGFLEYQKKQQEELAAYNETSAEDINKAKKASRFLIQPAANQNINTYADDSLLEAATSNTKDVTYKFQSKDVVTDTKEYNLKTTNITINDTSDFYKNLATYAIDYDAYNFSKQYGDLSTHSLEEQFNLGKELYEDWHTQPISYISKDGSKDLINAADGGVLTYGDTQNNSSRDYYSLAYQNRSIIPAVGQTVNIFGGSGYDYNSLVKEAIDSFENHSNTVFDGGIVYPHVPENGTYPYHPFKLRDEIWELYGNRKASIAANETKLGIYNPDGAWAENEQSFFNKIPLLGDLQQKLSDLEGSSILWQAFYNKKSTDPTQIYKIAAFNENVIGMTGRFVPKPPLAEDIRFVSSSMPSALGEKIAGPIDSIMGNVPSYPYIPLPYAMPQYKIFTPKQMILNWDVKKLASPATSKYTLIGWKPLGDLKDREDYFEELTAGIPSYLPSGFGYEQLKDFEGHTTIYDLQIKKPSNLNVSYSQNDKDQNYQNNSDELPDFICDENGSWSGRSLANFTSITAIPDIELKAGSTYTLGEFGSFLLSANYMNYVSNIQTKTLETAECDCYKWAKKFLCYFYGVKEPNALDISKYRHRSLYQSFYVITISKIFYENSATMPIRRHIISKDFYGVPTFNLTESVNENKLQEFVINWNIIGQSNEIRSELQNIPEY